MISIKRGDTFAFYANITDDQGEPLTLDPVYLKSQVRDTEYNLVDELTIATTETPGKYLFSSQSTENWPTLQWGNNTLLMDIEINNGGQITSSDTIKITVVKDVSYNG